MATKKTINKTKEAYINTELQWAEEQLQSWRAYVDDHPLHEMKDRIEWKPTAKGGLIPMVIASIEAQGKFIQETMKNYLALLEVVDKLRQREEEKEIELRGKQDPSMLQREFISKRM